VVLDVDEARRDDVAAGVDSQRGARETKPAVRW
jgi:hypothetical protein